MRSKVSVIIAIAVVGIIANYYTNWVFLPDSKSAELTPNEIHTTIIGHQPYDGMKTRMINTAAKISTFQFVEYMDKSIINNEVTSQKPSNTELYEYALELVNEDREKFGAKPVVLGTNPSAQGHADDMFRLNYLSHWNSKNVKPYVAYTESGGRGSVSENVATSKTYCPSSKCIPYAFDPLERIKNYEHKMIYQDGTSNWAHKETIMEPYATHVNFGIAYDDDDFYFVQNFEKNIVDWSKIELTDDNELRMVGKLPKGFSLQHMTIYADENPKDVNGKALNEKFPYNQIYYDSGKLVGIIVKHPSASNYEECGVGKIRVTNSRSGVNCIDYATFDNKNKDSSGIDVSVDVSKWLAKDELHTLYVILNYVNGDQVAATSVTLEYLK